MSDMAGDIFTALAARFAIDTGAGGLNEASGAALVRHFVRRGDPNFEVESGRTHNWPMIVVDVFNTEDRFFGQRHANSFVRMHLYTNRDANTSAFTTQDTVGSRINGLFDGYQPATQGGTVAFSLLNQLRDFQGPTSGVELHRVFEFSVYPVVSNAV